MPLQKTSNTTLNPAIAPAVPTLDWQPCKDPDQQGFQCATAQVPLDYQNPSAESIQLAVIKYPATDQSRRIGTLFFNPGGPGGPGTEDLPAWFSLFPQQLKQQFDIVSFDPRGIGNSTAVECFASKDDANNFFASVPQAFPVGTASRLELCPLSKLCVSKTNLPFRLAQIPEHCLLGNRSHVHSLP